MLFIQVSFNQIFVLIQKKKILRLKKNVILYKSRGQLEGSIVSHLGEVHLGKKASGDIINNIK